MKKYTFVLIMLFTAFTFFVIAGSNTKPVVQKVDCVGCGDCIVHCPVGAIKIINGKAVIDSKKCINCKLCVTSCTYDAIK